MGDRVHARFRLGGHVETIEECEILINAIASESVHDDNRDEYIRDVERAKTSLRHAVENGVDPSFYGNDVNYGTFDEIESAISETVQVGAYFTWDAGGGFPAGMKTIMPNGEEERSEGSDDATVSLTEIVKARKADDPLAAIDLLIAQANIANGADLPTFTVSPAVATWLKIFGERAA